MIEATATVCILQAVILISTAFSELIQHLINRKCLFNLANVLRLIFIYSFVVFTMLCAGLALRIGQIISNFFII